VSKVHVDHVPLLGAPLTDYRRLVVVRLPFTDVYATGLVADAEIPCDVRHCGKGMESKFRNWVCTDELSHRLDTLSPSPVLPVQVNWRPRTAVRRAGCRQDPPARLDTTADSVGEHPSCLEERGLTMCDCLRCYLPTIEMD